MRAAAQPQDGKPITTLERIAGRIYAGYGNYSLNTGPIWLTSLDETDPLGAWTEHIEIATEQIATITAISGGRIIVPRIDPQGPPGAAYATYDGTWQDGQGPTAEHCYAAAEAAGHLFLAGSQVDGQHGGIWTSDDGGDTWSLEVTSTVAGDFARFYFLAVIGDEVYAQEAGEPPGDATGWKWTAADGWQQIARFLPDGTVGGTPRPLGEGVVIPTNEPGDGSNGTLRYFDGTTTRLLIYNTNAWTIHDGLVWALVGQQLKTVTAEGVTANIARVRRTGVQLRSMVILDNGSILFGTSAGDVALVTADQLA